MAFFKIGIAGYMGSGKTTCCRSLAAMDDFHVLDGDAEARSIMQQSLLVQHQLERNFGAEITENGAVSFKKLGAIVFNDPIKLQKLNAIVHPLLLDRLRKTIFGSGSGVIILDAALLPLWKIEKWFDLRIWIDAAFDTRLDRLMRKGLDLTEGELRMRMRQQEALFAPPAPGLWKYFANEDGRETLGEAVLSYIRSAIDKR